MGFWEIELCIYFTDWGFCHDVWFFDTQDLYFCAITCPWLRILFDC